MSRTETIDRTESSAGIESWLAEVQNRVHSIQYGLVQITLHEGRVTQIDATEKMRIPWEGAQSEDRRLNGRPAGDQMTPLNEMKRLSAALTDKNI